MRIVEYNDSRVKIRAWVHLSRLQTTAVLAYYAREPEGSLNTSLKGTANGTGLAATSTPAIQPNGLAGAGADVAVGAATSTRTLASQASGQAGVVDGRTGVAALTPATQRVRQARGVVAGGAVWAAARMPATVTQRDSHAGAEADGAGAGADVAVGAATSTPASQASGQAGVVDGRTGVAALTPAQ